ncbi:MAG: DedA family protein [Acidobacteriota bacterium]
MLRVPGIQRAAHGQGGLTVLAFASLVLGTFISEDLACVAAGLLIQRAEIGASTAVLACTIGIFVGDLGLWAAGRLFGRAVLTRPWVCRQLTQERVSELRGWLERHAAAAIVVSRFLPGTRLPLYLLAGILKLPGGVFAAWALVGTLLWTPALVLVTARLGDAFAVPVSTLVGLSWVPHVLIALGVLSFLHLLRNLDRRRVRTASVVRHK